MNSISLPSQIQVPLALGNTVVTAIKALYGVSTTMDTFIDGQVEAMKKSASANIRATGAVIEGARFGFGIGYVTPLLIIAVGQVILGNPLNAVATVAKGAVLSNPLAMTCGAVGAIYYGWNALSGEERDAILGRMTAAFDIGAELVKAVLGYVVRTLGSLVSAENLEEFRQMVADTARSFGKSLSDITHSVTDRISDAAYAVTESVSKTADIVRDGVSAAAGSVMKGASAAAVSIRDTAGSAARHIRKTSGQHDER